MFTITIIFSSVLHPTKSNREVTSVNKENVPPHKRWVSRKIDLESWISRETVNFLAIK